MITFNWQYFQYWYISHKLIHIFINDPRASIPIYFYGVVVDYGNSLVMVIVIPVIAVIVS